MEDAKEEPSLEVDDLETVFEVDAPGEDEESEDELLRRIPRDTQVELIRKYPNLNSLKERLEKRKEDWRLLDEQIKRDEEEDRQKEEIFENEVPVIRERLERALTSVPGFLPKLAEQFFGGKILTNKDLNGELIKPVDGSTDQPRELEIVVPIHEEGSGDDELVVRTGQGLLTRYDPRGSRRIETGVDGLLEVVFRNRESRVISSKGSITWREEVQTSARLYHQAGFSYKSIGRFGRRGANIYDDLEVIGKAILNMEEIILRVQALAKTD